MWYGLRCKNVLKSKARLMSEKINKIERKNKGQIQIFSQGTLACYNGKYGFVFSYNSLARSPSVWSCNKYSFLLLPFSLSINPLMCQKTHARNDVAENVAFIVMCDASS